MLLAGLPLASRAGEPLIVVETVAASALPYYEPEPPAARQRAGPATYPDARVSRRPADEPRCCRCAA